jgi:hypothetical protein
VPPFFLRGGTEKIDRAGAVSGINQCVGFR